MKTSEANAQTATTNLEITKSSGSKKSAKKNVAKKSKSKRPGEASAAERSSSPQFVHVIEDDDSQMDDESYYVEWRASITIFNWSWILVINLELVHAQTNKKKILLYTVINILIYF